MAHAHAFQGLEEQTVEKCCVYQIQIAMGTDSACLIQQPRSQHASAMMDGTEKAVLRSMYALGMASSKMITQLLVFHLGLGQTAVNPHARQTAMKRKAMGLALKAFASVVVTGPEPVVR